MNFLHTLQSRHIILGSGSPRRKQFLEDLGLDFEIRLKPVEENFPPQLPIAEVASYLAKLKTRPYMKELKAEEILITGDTIVCRDGQVLGKPKSFREAFAMLRSLSGRSH